MLLSLIFCFLAIQQPLIAQKTDSPYACETSRQIQIEINRANPGTIENLLAKYPGNLWVQRAYIDFMLKSPTAPPRLGNGIPNGKVQESVIERFQNGYENNPDNPKSAYLYAYSLIHTDTEKSIEILTDITRETPSFPTAYLTLSILHGYSNFRDQQKQIAYTEAFLARCNDTSEPRVASIAVQLDRSDALIAYTKALRKRISGNADVQMITQYPSLWRLEEKIALPDEQAALNKRIEDDLKFLEGLDGATYATKGIILSQGYERLGDRAALEKLGKQNPQYAPMFNLTSFYRAQTDWIRSNPPPAPNADTKTRDSYFRKQVQFLDQWMDKVPENPTLLSNRFKALASIQDTSNDVLVHEGERILSALRSSRSSLINPSMDVLQTWCQRGILLERIPSLVHEFMKMPSQPAFLTAAAQNSDLGGSTQITLMAENNRWTANTSGWSILVTVHSKKREFDLARKALTEWEEALGDRQKKADEIVSRKRSAGSNTPASKPTQAQKVDLNDMLENSIVSGMPREKSRYYEACARLATAEGRSLDALTFIHSALRLRYGNSASLPGFEDLDGAKTASALWKELGGSQSGWKVWSDSIKTIPSPKLQSGPQWITANRTIPDFSLSDQDGKTWTLAGLKGKTTLINIWATWCGPCRLELPLLQKLYEQIKDSADIQIITLNVDADRSLVDPFLKENKFSFPSLYAKSFMDGFTGPLGIPTTWIADSTGTIRLEILGFGGDSSEWIQQTLKQLERVREDSGQIDVDDVRFANVFPTSVDLTGSWNGNDGGMYFIRQIGNEVWWYGRSKDDGKTWANVFQGTLDGGTVIGQWADVPQGSYLNSGIMILKIESDNLLLASQKTGGFGGSQWTRIIPDSREGGKGTQSTAKAKVEIPAIRDNSEQVFIGSLKWEICEDASGKILASGDGPIHLNDILITEHSDTPRRLIDKRINLTDEFDIGMAEYPATNPDEKVGFGITAKRTDIQSFSWEWFNIRGGKRAVKLQESGELGIDLKKVNDGWEITRTEFITDVSFRIIRSGVDPPGSPPYWRVKIFKGSSITWPSIVNGKVVPN